MRTIPLYRTKGWSRTYIRPAMTPKYPCLTVIALGANMKKSKLIKVKSNEVTVRNSKSINIRNLPWMARAHY